MQDAKMPRVRLGMFLLIYKSIMLEVDVHLYTSDFKWTVSIKVLDIPSTFPTHSNSHFFSVLPANFECHYQVLQCEITSAISEGASQISARLD